MPDRLNQLIDAAAVEKLRTAWGWRLPTWQEFQDAQSRRVLRINRLAAIQALRLRGVPKPYVFMHACLTLLSIAIVPIAALLWLTGEISLFAMVVSVLAVPICWRLSKQAAFNGVVVGAGRSEACYKLLVGAGVFYFEPRTRLPNRATPAEARVMLGVSPETWDIVGEYCKFVERMDPERRQRLFYPVSRLPYPKEQIKNALRIFIEGTTDKKFKKVLENASAYLSFAMEDAEYERYCQSIGGYVRTEPEHPEGG